MSAAPKLMTADEFLVWCLDQEGRWELVGGVPVLMMAGASRPHDLVVVNLISALRSRLRGSGCVPTTDDIASRMFNGNLRRPDVTIDCGRIEGELYESADPRVFFEVLSPSTQKIDFLKKPEEYRRVATLRHFVMLEPDSPRAWVWTRGDDGAWRDVDISGLEAELDLTAVNVRLPLSEIYEDVELEG